MPLRQSRPLLAVIGLGVVAVTAAIVFWLGSSPDEGPAKSGAPVNVAKAERSGHAAPSPRASLGTETPDADAVCSELADLFAPADHPFSEVYDPSTRQLQIVTRGRSLTIDVDDDACLSAHPHLAEEVARVLARQRRNDLSECRSTVRELRNASGQMPSESQQALKKHAAELCETFGIAVP